jgi:hypothetical protein
LQIQKTAPHFIGLIHESIFNLNHDTFSKALSNSPIAAIRAFAAIFPAILEEDPEGAKAALAFARQLAEGLQPWQDLKVGPRDGAHLRVAAIFRNRLAASSANIAAHVPALADLCRKADAIPLYDLAAHHDRNEANFHVICDELEEAWKREQQGRA